MVIRILGSKICRPSRFHKPPCYTSYRPNSTSSDQRDDEVAKRLHSQKIIDFVFGPPNFYELDSIEAPNLTAKEDDVTKIERSKEKAVHTKTDGILGTVDESVQNNEELPHQEAVTKYYTSYRPNSTSLDQRDDEVAKRQHCQKIIDFVFGPPNFYELDSIKVPNLTAKEDGVTKMERSNVKAMHTETDGTLGRVHECVQYNEEVPHQKATAGALDTQLEQNSQRQDQLVEGSIIRATAEKDEAKEYDLLQKSLPNLNSTNIKGPNYHRQMETQMYNNLANRYLKRETEQIDMLLLAKEMENLEVGKSVKQSDDANPVNAPEHAVYTPTEKAEPQTYYTGNIPPNTCQQWRSNNLEPHQNVYDMATASSIKENVYDVYKLQNYTNAPSDELVPLHLTQCWDFNQVDSAPENNNIHVPIEKLQLDDNLPTHFLLPATLNKDNGADWTDESRTIIQPIGEPCTIFQFRTQPRPSRCTNPEDKAGAQTLESHRMQEAKQPAEVPNEIENIIINLKCFQEQTNLSTKINLIKVNVSEHTDTSKRSCVQAQIVNEQIIGQPELSTQAKQIQVVKDDFAQQVGTPRIMEDTDRIRRTDTMVQSCVHAQPLPKTELKTESERSIDDAMITDLHSDPKLSLSEILKRVRAYNRLQYCKEIGMQSLNMSSMISSKGCPPGERPQSPPPPDCEKDCPPPSKPKCPDTPECQPEKKCPPPQPKCPPDPPECPGPSKPPSKCPGKCGCQSTDSYAPITVASYGRLSLNIFLFSCTMKEYFAKIIQWLLKLRRNSLDSEVFMAGPNSEAEILQLNRVKDFEPWTPIPSWPYPPEDRERKLQCPFHGCPGHKPGPVRPPCPPLPCSGLPKRLSFSAI